MSGTVGRSAHAVIAGGGTAGHVLPALAVADALVDRGHRVTDIHYVGARRGIEAELLPGTGYPYTLLEVIGLQRRFTLANLAFVPLLVRAVAQARLLLRRLRPAVVVSVGGYASLPAVIAARLARIPVVVVSYDRRPGRASALAARWATASAVAFPGSPLPRAVVTGAPVRREILVVDREADRDAARGRLGVDEGRFLLVVVGGSLGSGVLNAVTARYVREHHDDDALAVFHVTGRRSVDDPPAADGSTGGVWYRRAEFADDMATLYAAADLWLGRGGASTVHEVAATGTPAVLVPWAGAAEDHQVENVRWLSERGAATLVAEGQPEAVIVEIERLRTEPAARATLAARAREAGAVHRRGGVANLIDSIALA
jgi:UDP-N-acetylglucosamine--N-acetylmuramyl-(pentapeptide) pyrophosphoryl-undecaprenol N-acetylglucosamine transferase